MKKTTKALLTALCAVLLVMVSVMGTMAYLTYTTVEVRNTFSVGKVAITLDEAKVDEYGEPVEGAERVTENTYKLIPGRQYTKDPTVHVATGSEDSWLFVKVDNGIVDIEAANTIAAQMAANGWTLVDGETNIYAFENIVSEGDSILVFGTFTVADGADVDAYETAVIAVTAYAIQADGFGTAAEAWTAANLA